MVKVQNRSLFVLLLVATCLAPPVLADSKLGRLAQSVDNPEAVDSPDGDAADTAPTEADPAAAESPGDALTFAAPAALPAGASLRIEGSSSMSVITRSLVQAFEQKYPDASVTVVEQPSVIALENLKAGETELAAIGLPLSEAEKSAGLTAVSVSREKIAVIVGPENPFQGQLESVDFVNIFWGTVNNWSQVGGPDIPLRFVDRPETSDTRTALGDYEIFGGDLSTGQNATQVSSDSTAEVVEALGDNGIGYAIASQVTDQENVRIVPLHETLPDNSLYPYSQPRNYVFLDSTPLTPAAEAFLALATGTEGQAAVVEAKAAEAADVALAELPDQISAVRPDGQGLVTGDRDGNLNFWNADGTAASEAVPAHTGPVTALAFSADGQRLLSGGADGTTRWWDAAGTAIGDPVNSDNGPVTSVIVQPDGSYISATNQGVLQWRDASGNPTGEPIPAHEGAVRDMALSQDGSTLITAGDDGTIRLWNTADGTPQGAPLSGHQGPVQALSIQPDGSFFSGGADSTVRQWAPDGTPVGEPLQVSGPVNAIATNADGTSIVVGDETGALRYLSGDGVPVGEPLTDVGAPVADLAFTPDGQQLFVSAGDSPQLRDSTGQIITTGDAASESPENPAVVENLPPQLQAFWEQLQSLPPQVLWIIPLAVLVILLLGLLRSFHKDEEDLVEDDFAELPPTAPTVEDDANADDFSAEDFSAADFSSTETETVPDVSLASFTDSPAGAVDTSLAKAKQTLQEGVGLGNMGRYQVALDRFNKAIELADMERLKAAAAGTTLVGAEAMIARGLARRGAALANLGRSEEALNSLNRALEMDPNDAAAWIGKGNVFIPMGQLDEALFCFDKAIELNPNLAAAWQGKGKALRKMGRDAEARNAFSQSESLGGMTNEDTPMDLGTPAVTLPDGENLASSSTRRSTANELGSPSPLRPTTEPDDTTITSEDTAIQSPAIAPGPAPVTSAPDLPSDSPVGQIGFVSSEPNVSAESADELPPELLAAISDLPEVDQDAPDPTRPTTPSPSPTAPLVIEPSAPLPETSETAIPEDVLEAVNDLPTEPDTADTDAPLTNPTDVPPEVEAILRGESDLPITEETASDVAVNEVMTERGGDDVTVAQVPSSPDSTTNVQAGSSPVPDQPEADDAALAGLPPDVLEALQGIPADSPDSFDLPRTDRTPSPPPPPTNPRLQQEEDN